VVDADEHAEVSLPGDLVDQPGRPREEENGRNRAVSP
jgi:hypothetical protein